MRIGVISDTHSFLDPQVLEHFSDCDEIWHGGDIGVMRIIDELAKMKTVRAVHGNIDDRQLRQHFPEDLWFEVEGKLVYITHIAGKPPRYNARVLKNIRERKPDILVCGHSHILRVIPDKVNNLLYINPGAAGQHGFHTVRTIIKMTIANSKISDMVVVELGKRGALTTNS